MSRQRTIDRVKLSRENPYRVLEREQRERERRHNSKHRRDVTGGNIDRQSRGTTDDVKHGQTYRDSGESGF